MRKARKYLSNRLNELRDGYHDTHRHHMIRAGIAAEMKLVEDALLEIKQYKNK